MQNIIDYVEEKGIFSFAEFPFTDVDSLILSQLAYWKFDGFVPSIDEEDRDITFLNLLEHENVSTLFTNVWDIPSNTALLKALAGSDRYGEVTLHYYVNDMDIAAQKQFSALTLQVGTAFLYLAFRGTDDSFVGWKEDFDMACETPVPSQLAGVKYLSDVAQKVTGTLVTGGHSKGGNIAEYAAVSCPKKISSRIVAIYNHDAPGFHRAFYSSPRYMAVKDKIHKTVPQASLFGMLFQQQEPYTIVKSNHIGLLQHDPFSWETESGDFAHAPALTPLSRYRNSIIDEWLTTIDDKTRRSFIDTLYSVITSTKATNFEEFRNTWQQSLVAIFRSMKGLDEHTKQDLWSLLLLFFKSALPGA